MYSGGRESLTARPDRGTIRSEQVGFGMLDENPL
jgi:hypothetical protein